ncbi:O-antigen ligase family protein [Polycladomyces sp. WAk]|uniref:O-antigen ligase family protein n=1 Tax=Polycladomyces zharkentensis TaxID=2807616 RepID=A0ABS2WLK2_9BACL|nr:O-antigen ligase family protein [Polycladomyces sp. WAk]MBN2910442.1 O-antigen ligase family protein [Polycladomyces sp. WAk]
MDKQPSDIVIPDTGIYSKKLGQADTRMHDWIARFARFWVKGVISLKIETTQQLAIRIIHLLFLSILMSPWLPPLVMLGIGLLTPFFYKCKWPVRGWPEGIFLGFAFLSLISWAFNPSWFWWIPIGIIPIILFGLYYLLTIWIKHLADWSWQQLQRLYLQFWLGGIYVAIVVIMQRWDLLPHEKSFWTYMLGFYPLWQTDMERSVGTAANSNLAAAMLICLALMSIYASSVVRGAWKKVGCFTMFAMYSVAIWCTGSRGAWVGLLIGLLVQVWMTGNRRRTVLLFCALLLLGGVIYTNQTLIPREETLFATVEVRIFVWQHAFQIFREHWLLGVLPLHFGQLFAKMTGKYMFHAHNVFLGIATEYGIIGLGLFLALIAVTTYRARRWRKTANRKEEKRLAGLLISILFALLGHGMYDYPIISPQIGLIFILSLIMIHAQYERRCLKKPEWSQVSYTDSVSEKKMDKWEAALITVSSVWKALPGGRVYSVSHSKDG